MMSATEPRASAAQWLPAERLGECRVEAGLRPWLIGKGPLCERLREHLGSRFELRAGEPWTAVLDVDERRHLGTGDGAALYREEALCCEGRTWALVRAILPDSTLAAHPWFAELGEAGLGETLAGLSGVVRGKYEYAWLPEGSPLARGTPSERAPGGLWARRCRVCLRGAPLALYEMFLPGLGQA